MSEITYESIKTGFQALKNALDKDGDGYPDRFVIVFGNVNNELYTLDEAIGGLVEMLSGYVTKEQCVNCGNMLPETEKCLFCGHVVGEEVESEGTEEVEEGGSEEVESEETEKVEEEGETEETKKVEEEGENKEPESVDEQSDIPAFVTNPGSKAHIVYSKVYYGATIDQIVEALKAEYPKGKEDKLRKGIMAYIYSWNTKYGWNIKKDDNGVYKVS